MKFTNELPVFKIRDSTSSTFFIPSANSSVVSFRLDVDSSVVIQLIADKKTVLYEKKNVKFCEDKVTFDRKYANPRFVVDGKAKFDGTLSVNVTSPRWDTQSTEFTWMCETYPCVCDLKNENLHGKDLWVVTENNASQVYDIHNEFQSLFVDVSLTFNMMTYC